MEAEGHIVGNHTMTSDMSKISTQGIFQKELSGVEDIYKEITDKEMTKFYQVMQIYSTLNLSLAKDGISYLLLESCLCGLVSG